jgi:hypothetical protein
LKKSDSALWTTAQSLNFNALDFSKWNSKWLLVMKQGSGRGFPMEKTRGKESRETAPLIHVNAAIEPGLNYKIRTVL